MGGLRWRGRGSSVGNYLICDYRAAHDRAIAEGQIPLEVAVGEVKPRDTHYRSLGSCIHFELQDGLRCRFAPKDMSWVDSIDDDEEETSYERDFHEISDRHFNKDDGACLRAHQAGDPRVYQPTPAMYADAALLFGKDESIARESIRASARLAAPQVPKSPDGQPWLCESTHGNEHVTGHTDFLSQDGSVFGDLKTTSKPPTHGWIAYEHLAQMAVYHNLTKAPLSWILYVDSMHARWTNLVWVDWTQPGKRAYAEHVADYSAYLCSPELFDRAIPRLGPHCTKNWCPYLRTCYHEHMPPRGAFIDARAVKQATGPITWGGKVIA